MILIKLTMVFCCNVTLESKCKVRPFVTHKKVKQRPFVLVRFKSDAIKLKIHTSSCLNSLTIYQDTKLCQNCQNSITFLCYISQHPSST